MTDCIIIYHSDTKKELSVTDIHFLFDCLVSQRSRCIDVFSTSCLSAVIHVKENGCIYVFEVVSVCRSVTVSKCVYF